MNGSLNGSLADKVLGVKQSGQRGKGDGALFQEASGRWVGVAELGFVDGKRKRRKVVAPTKREAAAKLRKLMRDIESDEPDEKTTLDQWLDVWLRDICPHRVAPLTLYNYGLKLARYVRPKIGRIELGKLTPDHIRAVHAAMRAQGLSETTVRQAHVILSRALKVAEREGRVRRNVAALVDAPGCERNPHEVLSVGQARAVLEAAGRLQGAAGARTLARLTCALVLGLRQGEALALQWADVDLDAGMLHVRESLQHVPAIEATGQQRQTSAKAPKTASSRRDVPLPAGVADVLRAWRALSSGRGHVFPGFSGDGPEGARRDWKAWADALNAAGVPHVPLQGARGTTASLLQAMGVPERMIADILGHANVRVTLDHYLHSDAEQRLAALEGLAGTLSLGDSTTT